MTTHLSFENDYGKLNFAKIVNMKLNKTNLLFTKSFRTVHVYGETKFVVLIILLHQIFSLIRLILISVFIYLKYF